LKAALIDPYAVGLKYGVGDEGIEIAIAIEVTEGDFVAAGVAVTGARKQREGAIGILIAKGIHFILVNAVGLGAGIGDEGIEIAIAIEVAEDDILAILAEEFERLTIVGIGAEISALIAALVDPHAVFVVAGVGDPGIEIAIAIEVPEGDMSTIGVTESLATVGIGAGSAALKTALVDPYLVGFLVAVGDPCIEITIAIDVFEGDTAAIGAAESLTVVGIVAGSAELNAPLVDPHAVGLTDAVGDEGIEVAISIEITEGNTEAGGVAESLTPIGIGPGSAALIASLVDPHAVGLVVPVGDEGVEVAIAIDITEDDTAANGVTESLTTVGIGAGSTALKASLIDPNVVGLADGGAVRDSAVGDESIEITIAIDIAEGDRAAIGANGVTESLTTVGIGAGSAALKASLIVPHEVGFVAAVGDEGIEIAIAIDIPESNTEAIVVVVTGARKQREGAIGIIAIDQGIPIVIDAVGANFGDLGLGGYGAGQA
jgi:hypothetical protein